MSRKRQFDEDTVQPVKKARFADENVVSRKTAGLDLPKNAMDLAVEEALEGSAKSSVKLQGYDSDSESEGEGPSKVNTAADEDEDMFSTAQKPTSSRKDKRDPDDSDRIKDSGLEVTGNKEGKDYLDLGDIGGQEFGRASDEHGLAALTNDAAEESDSQESFVEGDEHANDDEAPRSRRTKKGMGYKISRFNMKDEMEEGRFTAEGTFIANDTDPFAQHDTWLDDVSTKSTIKAARRAQERQEQLARQADQADREAAKTRAQCMIDLLESGLLDKEKDETVTSALARFGATKKSYTQKKRGQKSNSMQVDGDAQRQLVEHLSAQIDQLTSLASLLLDVHGETDIYEQSFMDLVKTLRLEGEVPRGWEPKVPVASQSQDAEMLQEQEPAPVRRGIIARPSSNASEPTAPVLPPDSRQFMYNWKPTSGVPPDQLKRSFGPFSGDEMRAWMQQNFFGPAGANITISLAGQDEFKEFSQLIS